MDGKGSGGKVGMGIRGGGAGRDAIIVTQLQNVNCIIYRLFATCRLRAWPNFTDRRAVRQTLTSDGVSDGHDGPIYWTVNRLVARPL